VNVPGLLGALAGVLVAFLLPLDVGGAVVVLVDGVPEVAAGLFSAVAGWDSPEAHAVPAQSANARATLAPGRRRAFPAASSIGRTYVPATLLRSM
jgi:hypothetical protein